MNWLRDGFGLEQDDGSFNYSHAQSLDTDVQRPFYSVATVALLPYEKRTTMVTLNKKGVAYRYQATVLPWRWQILSIQLEAGWGKSAETCGLDDVFPSDDLGSGPYSPFIIHITYITVAI